MARNGSHESDSYPFAVIEHGGPHPVRGHVLFEGDCQASVQLSQRQPRLDTTHVLKNVTDDAVR
jgi:hypothetical protein